MSAILPAKQTVANIYNPQNQSKEQLVEGFVVRRQLFQNLYKTIKEARMETPEQHYLLLGRRGMGKTTLLLRLAYEIENDDEINQRLIPLVFNEEEYGIRSLFKLWERVMELLEDKHPDFKFEPHTLKQIGRNYAGDNDGYEKALYDWLSGELKRRGKKLILFMDNFGDMARKLSDAEAHRFRKILQTDPDIRIFAASSVVLEAFYSYDHPFYEFFKTEELKGLNKAETRELLLGLSRHYNKASVERIIKENPGRVEALRRITGGVIRSMVLLFEIFSDDEDGSAFHDLQIILDRVSPLYKHRMDDLSDPQQAIVEVIALHWDAVSVKEIAEQTRMESKVVSAQLHSLEKNGIIEKRSTRTKNHLYLISERFFNIWFLMRLGRKSDQKRVLWLVRFFEDWCDGDLIKKRAESHIAALRRGSFDLESAYYLTQAISAVPSLDIVSQHRLWEVTHGYLSGKDEELAHSLEKSDLSVAVEAIEKWYSGEENDAIAMLKKARPFARTAIQELLDKNETRSPYETNDAEVKSHWQIAMARFAGYIGGIYYNDLQAPIVARKCLAFAASDGDVSAMIVLGTILFLTKDLKKAEDWYLKAAEKETSDALVLLGILYQDYYNDLQKAEEWYLKATENGNAHAMARLGFLYQDDLQKAEEWYLKATEKGNAFAMNNLGVLYHNEYKDLQKAEEWYLKAANNGNAEALRNLGVLYHYGHKDLQKAKNWYLKATDKGDIVALRNLGVLYHNDYKDLQKAEDWYLKATENGDAGAMNNLGVLYHKEHKDLQKAEDWYLKAADKGNIEALRNLGALFENEYKDIQKAEDWFLKAVNKGDAQAMYLIGRLYRYGYKNHQKALEWCQKASDNGNLNGISGVSWLLFELGKDKALALESGAKAFGNDSNDSYYALSYARVLLWDNRIQDAIEVAVTIWRDQDYQERFRDDIAQFLTLFIAKKQEQFLYDLFNSPVGIEHEFKDRFKPIWYAVLKKLDHPDFLRMGDELTQTVDEILAKAEQLAEEYK